MTEGFLSRVVVSKIRNLLSIGAVGITLCFAHGNTRAACSVDTTISTALGTQQAIGSGLGSWQCSLTVTESGSITVTNGNGVYNQSGITLTTLNNNGQISASGNSGTGINNEGTITTLNNSNQISASGNSGTGINNSGTITTMNNSSQISAGAYTIFNRASGTIAALNNTGSITASGSQSYGIVNQGTITTLSNSGSGSISGRASGIFMSGGSTITTLNNSASISSSGGAGISSYGTITTLNNKQGASSSPLTYTGTLPVNYNIIIAGTTDFGKLAGSSVSGTTTFGISSLSTTSASILNTPLSAVLSGISSELLLNTSGTSNGYTFALTQTTPTSGTWNLLITVCSVCSSGSNSGSSSGSTSVSTVSSGTSVGLASIGASPVLSGGTLVLLSGDSSSTAFSVAAASTIQNPSSGSATLSGVFSGAGSLAFTGSGTTVLSGANTYSGGTTVSGGTLSLSGGSPTGTGDVFVASAGTLMGTGTIGGNLTVAGVLKPGNSPGYLVASNNVSLSTGSTYQQDIAGLTQASSATPVGATGYYSLLSVGGQFAINSSATLTPRLSNLFTSTESGYGSAIYIPALGDRFRMVTATGGISGRFSTLTQPAELATGTQFIAFYNVNGSNSIDLATVPTSYASTLSSSTTNAKEVASVLDQVLGLNKTNTATSAQDQLLYAASGQTAASLPGFAQALSGEIHAASAATLPQATQRVQQAVLARLGDFPMAPNQLNGGAGAGNAPTPLSSGAITGNNPSGLPTSNMSSNPAVNPNSVNLTSAAVADGRAWGEIA